MDENIYDFIKENQDIEVNEDVVVEEKTFLLFSINEKIYAAPSNFVRELLRDVDVFPLPFVPSYIDGVLNRYGDPYVVIDPALLLRDGKQNNSLFLVFNDDNKISIRISDVYDFYTIPVTDIKTFTDQDVQNFYQGTFKYKDDDVLILNQEAIIERVEKDFERL